MTAETASSAVHTVLRPIFFTVKLIKRHKTVIFVTFWNHKMIQGSSCDAAQLNNTDHLKTADLRGTKCT